MSNKKISILVCTFNRAEVFATCLRAVLKQCEKLRGLADFEIIVVDNDSSESAKETWELIASTQKVPTRYLCEPRGGVGNARNTALDNVSEGSWALFFDDDQIPGERWLLEFMSITDEFHHGCFSGPVIPTFGNRVVPKWAAGLWAWGAERSIGSNLEPLRTAGFGNFLISPDLVKQSYLRVTRPYLRGPGEDTSVTLRLTELGCPIYFLSKAIAYEPIALERMSFGWVIRRKFMEGIIWGHVSRQIPRFRRYLPLSILKQLACAAAIPFCFWQPSMQRRLAISVAKLALASGILVSAVGIDFLSKEET